VTARSLITISIPVLNEADNIDALIKRLQAVAAVNAKYDFEFIFTDNASTDATFQRLAEVALAEPRIRAFRFSRNFGFQRSILFNLLEARGRAAIQIDADLQDPPELFTDFLKKWEEGYEVVYGIRRQRREGRLLQLARKMHYRLLRSLSETDVPVDAGDFRLVDRKVIENLRNLKDRDPYLRGIIASIGFSQIGIVYDRSERRAGRSKFNLPKLIVLSLDGIVGQSTRPLQLITLFGFFTSAFCVLATVAYFMVYLFALSSIPRGFTTLVLLILISIGLNAAMIGILGEYVGRIFNMARGGPVAIVSDRIEPVDDGHAHRMDRA
jgi:dolichol-phosphate mannosyltransferase